MWNVSCATVVQDLTADSNPSGTRSTRAPVGFGGTDRSGQCSRTKATRSAYVATCPLLVTMWLDNVQPLDGPAAFATNATAEPLWDSNPSSGPRLSGSPRCNGGNRCALTHNATPMRTNTKPTSVVAIAGTVRRNTAPENAPRAKANN